MNFRFLIERVLPFRRRLGLISALSVLVALSTLAIPWLAGKLLGGFVENSSQPLFQTLGLLVLALVLSTLLSILASIISARTAGQVLAQLRVEAYDHIQKLAMHFHDSASQGDLLALMTYEVSELSDFLTSTIARLPAVLLTAGGAMVLLFFIDPITAVIAPVLVPIFYVSLKLVGRKMRMLAQRAREAEAELVAIAERDLEMLGATKAFAAEDERSASYSSLAEKSRKAEFASDKIAESIGPITSLVVGLFAIGLVVVAATQFQTSGKSASELFALLFYVALLTRPVAELGNVYGSFERARGTLSRLEAVLSMPREDGYDSRPTGASAQGGIAFEDVIFAYPRRNTVLNGVSFRIEPGQTIALTGQNGAGKSTIVRLLLRLYELDHGAITLDGRDIREWPLQELRRQFGFVPQRALLFNGTIAENIAFASNAVSSEGIEKAARLAQAFDFISALPKGFETRIGDHGVRLSGGQGQRIALARALYHDPRILVFDEATSMFDLQGERAFVDQCADALRSRSAIIISHRPASLALADRILHVENGQIRELDASERAQMLGRVTQL